MVRNHAFCRARAIEIVEKKAAALMDIIKYQNAVIFFSFDGDGEVMSRVRRGVLSLCVVRQMLS